MGQPDHPILIAGGGIGGLSAAIALARSGYRVHLAERASEFPTEGAGIQLGPNATRLLREWRVTDRFRDKDVRPEAIRIRDAHTGGDLATVPLGAVCMGRYGAPYCVVHRADLLQALLETAQAERTVTIATGCELKQPEVRDGCISLTVSGGGRLDGRALIAADGLWSALRESVERSARLAFARKTAWRALVPADALPPNFRAAVTGLWLAPNAHLVHYPVRGGAAVNVVAVIEDAWRETGWNAAAEAGDLLPSFRSWVEEPQALLAAAQDWRKWALYRLPPLQRLHRGRIALLGDAAHPVLPFLAQGGALAIEDAAVLAAMLRKTPRGIEKALARYGAARRARVARVQEASRRMGVVYHLWGPARWARNLSLRSRRSAALLSRFDWLYGFDAREP